MEVEKMSIEELVSEFKKLKDENQKQQEDIDYLKNVITEQHTKLDKNDLYTLEQIETALKIKLDSKIYNENPELYFNTILNAFYLRFRENSIQIEKQQIKIMEKSKKVDTEGNTIIEAWEKVNNVVKKSDILKSGNTVEISKYVDELIKIKDTSYTALVSTGRYLGLVGEMFNNLMAVNSYLIYLNKNKNLRIEENGNNVQQEVLSDSGEGDEGEQDSTPDENPESEE
jgi:hypothetical protein